LVSLSTLAAGAAHELATPLATIAVAAHELERDEVAGQPEGHRVEDARLIRAQVERCRAILLQMGESAGQAAGEASEAIDANDLVEHVRAALAPADRDRVEVVVPRDAPSVFAPRGSLTRALTNLLRNALDASEKAELVHCHVEAGAQGLRFVVSDRGVGMTPDVLARAGEPFFSTKPSGSGQGLGLFLAREVAEQLGGALRLESRPGAGTTAILELPLRSAAGIQAA
jgi:two-component system sensor histidine kinase RegB